MKNPKALTVDPAAYAKLLKVIRSEIAAGRKLIARTLAVTNWNVGKYISDFILQGKDRAGYGEYVYQKVAKDLNSSVNNLERMVRFSREFSISDARQKLDWTDYRTLLSLPDPSARRELARRALRENLNTRQIQKEVIRYKVDHKIVTDQPIPKLAAQRGRLYTYRLAEAVTPLAKGNVFVDCGFRDWYPAKCALRSLPKGAVVETIVSGNSFEVVKSARGEKDLYAYKAYLTRVVDADTPWAEIDLGLGGVTLQKMRLRGIDAPEISTAAGRRAKRFVEKLLKPCPFIVVKTYKDQSDKYDRYLVDVFFKPGELDPAKVAAEGELLNQRLLDEGLAVRYEG